MNLSTTYPNFLENVCVHACKLESSFDSLRRYRRRLSCLGSITMAAELNRLKSTDPEVFLDENDRQFWRFRKRFINIVPKSIRRRSVCPSVRTYVRAASVTILVNASPTKPSHVAISNLACA